TCQPISGFSPFAAIALFLEDGDSAGETGRGALDLEREAGDHVAGRGQPVELSQLLDVAIADLHAGAVAFPDQRGIPGLGIAARGVDEGRVPAPRVGAGDAHAAAGEVERRLAAHAAAGGEVVVLAVFRAGRGVDDDDV